MNSLKQKMYKNLPLISSRSFIISVSSSAFVALPFLSILDATDSVVQIGRTNLLDCKLIYPALIST